MQKTSIGSGTGRFARSLFGGGAIENKSFADTLAEKMSFAAKAAQADKYRSETNLNNQRFNNMESGQNEFMQGATGLSQPQLDILNNLMKSGGFQEQDAGPPTAEGNMSMMDIPQPEWYTPEVKTRYGRARMASGANKMGTGKSNAEQIMNALLSSAALGRQDQMIEGSLSPDKVAPAYGATEGKPTYDVTSSGIGFKPYGNAEDVDNTSFINKANIDAKAKVDAVLARSNVNGGQLPAEAKLVKFYMSLNYPQNKAVEMARSKKNKSLSDIMLDEYSKTRETLKMFNPGMSDEEIDQQAEMNTLKAIDFLKRNQGVTGSKNNDPLRLR